MKIKILLPVLALLLVISGALLMIPNIGSHVSAQIVNDPTNPSNPSPATSSDWPASSNPLDGFKLEAIKSYPELLQQDLPFIDSKADPKEVAAHLDAVLSYIERINNGQVSGKEQLLPLSLSTWTTYGNFLPYIFSKASDPIAHAKERGLIPADATADQLMSGKKIIDLIGGVFFAKGKAYRDLTKAGIIHSTAPYYIWNSDETVGGSGIPLINAVTVVRRVVAVANWKHAGESKTAYEGQLTELPADRAVKVGESMDMLLQALSSEMHGGKIIPVDQAVSDGIKAIFKGQDDAPLTAAVIDDVRAAFYKASQATPPALFQPDQSISVGDCTKMQTVSFPAITKIGDTGLAVVCTLGEKTIITTFKSPGYALNLMFPNVTDLTDPKSPDSSVYRINFPKSMKNTLYIGDSGELRLRVTNFDQNAKASDNKSFKFVLTDDAKNVTSSGSKLIEDFGGELSLLPRIFKTTSMYAVFQ